MEDFTYSGVSVKSITSSDEQTLTEKFDVIDNIELNVSGSVAVYQITGHVTWPDGSDAQVKKVATVGDSMVTSYYIIYD